MPAKMIRYIPCKIVSNSWKMPCEKLAFQFQKMEIRKMPRPKKVTNGKKRRSAPGKTLEARENQLIAMAVDLAEQQLSEGTASSQVITHFLKLGSSTERLEKDRLLEENRLLKAKTDALKSAKRVEELYAEAIKAMRSYTGNP